MHTEVRDCYKRLSSVHTSSPLSLSLSRLFILSPVLKCSCVDIFTHYTGKGRCLHVSVCVCVCVCVCVWYFCSFAIVQRAQRASFFFFSKVKKSISDRRTKEKKKTCNHIIAVMDEPSALNVKWIAWRVNRHWVTPRWVTPLCAVVIH